MTGYPENRGGFSDVRIYDRTVRNRAIGAWFRIGVVSIPVRRWINMFRVMKGASMRWIPLLACAVFMVSILPVAALQADTIEVPLGGDIQAAIDGASDGDIIQLAAGTYNAYQISPGGRAITIQGSLHGDGSLATTIDAQQQGGPVIRINSGEGDGTVIKELVITGGQGNVGSGISCDAGTSPVILGCRISGNYGGFAAGGINCFQSSPTIIDCEITNSVQGTGLVLNASDVTLGSTTVCGNNSSELFVDDESTLIPLGGNCITDDCSDTDGDGLPDGCADCSDLDGDGLCDDVDPCPTWPGGCSGDGDRVLVTATDQSIQDAIDLVADGGTVEIIAGTFAITSTIDPGGKAVTILGAVDGDGAPATILDGGGSVRLLICQNGETEETSFENLVIRNGLADFGGGMHNDGSSPTLANCTFTDNSASYGGGMYNDGSSPTLAECRFLNNTANSFGGGMYNRFESDPWLTDCVFTGNTASEGGGMQNDSSDPTLISCTFSGNSAEDEGGGMNNGASSPTLTECTFSSNSAGDGAGIFNGGPSHPSLADCTFDGNVAQFSGGGIGNISGGGTVTLAECVFTANTATDGGGMCVDKSTAILSNCTFDGNTAEQYGGGMYIEGSTPTLTGCTFTSNSATSNSDGFSSYGGGIYSIDGGLSLIDCTFTSNTGERGAGVYARDMEQPTTFSDCRFIGNQSSNDGGGVSVVSTAEPFTAERCVFEGNISGDDGGGLHHANLPVTLKDCTFTGNTATDDGGGSACDGSTPRDSLVEGCVYADNIASGDGSALSILDANVVTVTGTTVCGGETGNQFQGDYTDGGDNCITAVCNDADDDGILDGCDMCPNWPGNCSEDGLTIYVTATDQSIRDAINLVADGGTVEIIAGTFTITSTINPGGKAVTIRGAVDGDGEPTTVLDGSGNRRVLSCTNNEDDTTVFENLRLANGLVWNGSGGGVRLLGSSPRFENCVFTNNSALSTSGITSQGGGMYCSMSSPTLVDCTFTGNTGHMGGGGLYAKNSSPTLIDCTFIDNVARSIWNGGGMFNENSSSTLIDCTITNNAAGAQGGGVFSEAGGSVDLTGTIICGNTVDGTATDENQV